MKLRLSLKPILTPCRKMKFLKAIEALEQEHPQYIEVGREIFKGQQLFWLRSIIRVNPPLRFVSKNFGHVKDHKSLAAAFADLNKNADVTDFETSVDRRLRLLSGELDTITSGQVGVHVVALINEMTVLKRLVGIHDSCMESSRADEQTTD